MKTNLHTNPIAGFTSVNSQERKDLGIRSGDTVKVFLKIKEKAKGGKGEAKIRIQVFEGLVLASKHGSEAGATFTVRKVSNGVGIERIFPLYSPIIDKIEIVKRAKVRRSKLYHIRAKVAREIKRAMRKTSLLGMATLSDVQYQAQLEQEAEAVLAQREAQEAEAQSVETTTEAPEEQVQEEAVSEELTASEATGATVKEASSKEATAEEQEVEDNKQEEKE